VAALNYNHLRYFWAVAREGNLTRAAEKLLISQSALSIQKFGLAFWLGDIWDPVSGEFGAKPFIWGTLYSSVLSPLIATPIALGLAMFISELCPAALRQPLVFVTELLAAIPSIVYGLWGIFVLVPFVRQLEASTPPWMKALPLFSGPPLGLGMLADVGIGLGGFGGRLVIDRFRRFRRRRGLVVVGHALLERLDPLRHVAHQLGDLAAPEQQQHYDNDHHPVPNAQGTH